MKGEEGEPINLVVIDLDGTLCNCSHRVHHAQNGDWDAFHEGLMDDTLVIPVGNIAHMFDENGFTVIALTGRPDKYRKLTMEWMQKAHVRHCFSDILMRPDDDYTHDAELKIRLLEEYCGSKELVLAQVHLVLDDRDKVVEAMRNYGLTVFQTRQGDY